MGRSFTFTDTTQIVYDDDGYSPLLGNDAVDSPYDFVPWKWDERIWMRRSMENLNSSIPVLWDPPWVRLPREYLLSGIGSKIDLEVLNIVTKRKESLDTWVPEIRHGNYFKFTRSRYLFANRSVIQFIHIEDNEGIGPGDSTYPDQDNPIRNTLQLSHIPRHGSPIFAALWGRNINDEPELIKYIRKRTDFTGLYDTAGQMSTRHGVSNDIRWNAVDQSKYEFILDESVSPPKAIFNQDFTYLIGRETFFSDDELEYCELLGRGNGESAQLFLTRRFPVVDNAEITLVSDHYYNEWARFRDIGRHGVRVTLVRNYGDPAEEVDCNNQMGHKFFVKMSSPTRPEDRGVYQIDTDRGEITFPEFLVTNPEDPQVGEVITRAPAVGELIYLRYRPTIEVEYEPENCDKITHPMEVNLNPLSTSLNEGFIYISEQDMRVAKIVLSVEKSLVYGETNVYGPVLIGSDYAFLIATAYNRFDIPIPGVTIELYFPDRITEGDFGRLGGHEDTASAVTNGVGEAKITYSPPRSVEEIGTYIKHPSGDIANKLTIPAGSKITGNSEIYTYSVWNGDRWRMYDVSRRRGGQKRVIYKWDDDAIHPRTGLAGAYAPMVPTVEGNKLVYADSLPFTIADEDLTLSTDPDWEENEHLDPLELAAYWVSAGTDIHIRARAYSTLYNRYIDSNSIYLRIDLPNYLKGTHVVENIGLTPPNRIPYGFRIFDEYFTGASGLDGLTYLSINPAAGYWGILWPDDEDGFMESTHRIEYANPFIDCTLGHKFSVSL